MPQFPFISKGEYQIPPPLYLGPSKKTSLNHSPRYPFTAAVTDTQQTPRAPTRPFTGTHDRQESICEDVSPGWLHGPMLCHHTCPATWSPGSRLQTVFRTLPPQTRWCPSVQITDAGDRKVAGSNPAISKAVSPPPPHSRVRWAPIQIISPDAQGPCVHTERLSPFPDCECTRALC